MPLRAWVGFHEMLQCHGESPVYSVHGDVLVFFCYVCVNTKALPPCFANQVTANAWKWPPLWPYTPDYFDRPDESDDEKAWATPKLTACLEGGARSALVSHYSRFLVDGAEILEIGEFISSSLFSYFLFSSIPFTSRGWMGYG